MSWLFPRPKGDSLKQAALHDAHELRLRYGDDAERWCELGLMAARDPVRRRELESIRQALERVRN
jgi:hypothetical protein